MRMVRQSSLWVKSAEVLILVAAVCFSLGASNASARVHDLSHRLICTCGCSELLGECSNPDCPSRHEEFADLNAQIASGKTDQQILNWFAVKYGATVLAAPPARGFDLIAWIAPFAVFGAALFGLILLIRHWGHLPGGKLQPSAVTNTANMDPVERARIEKIRRETGNDGGF